VQYSDYASWQRERLQPTTIDAQVAYWKGQLAGAPERLDLRKHRPAPPVSAPGGAQIPVAIDGPLRDALQRLGSSQGTTLFMTMLAGFAALLGRETQQTQVVIGIPVGNRILPEIEGLVGFFVNTLPVRIDLRGDPTFSELLLRVREVVVGAYAHQELPFERLVEELQPARRVTEAPVCQAVFNFSPAPDPMPHIPGLTVEPIDVPAEGAAYDLALLVEDGESGVRGLLRYRTDRLHAAAAPYLRAAFTAILQAATAEPGQHLASLQAAADHLQHLERRGEERHVRDVARQSLKRVRRKTATSAVGSERR
jgi:non-ribosomal peptide synthetase component F